MFKTVPRTVGVSTTNLVGRMLLLTKSHHLKGDSGDDRSSVDETDKSVSNAATDAQGKSPYTSMSKFLPSSRKIVQFSTPREPKPDDVIVYVDGAFDLFHAGHIAFLKAARALGDYLIVGLLADDVVNSYKGANYPIQNAQERTLSVLACRYVDEVIIGAPWACSADMIRDLRISIVVEGTVKDASTNAKFGGADPYADAKAAGVHRQLVSPVAMTTESLIERIIANRMQFIERNKAKEQREIAHLESEKKKAKIN